MSPKNPVPKELHVQVSAAIYRSCLVQTQACIMRDLMEHTKINKMSKEQGGPIFHLHYAHSANDALIGRCRSRIATMFLQSQHQADVLVMVDGDVEWSSGAVQLIAQRAYQEEAIVGAIVPKRNTGKGCAIAFNREFNERFKAGEETITIGKPGVIKDVEWLGAAFTAYPKPLFQRLIDQNIVPMVSQGFYPFFMETYIEYPEPKNYFHLSEDWYLVHLARKVGIPVWAETALTVRHWGEYPYTVEDAWNKPERSNEDGVSTVDKPDLRHAWAGSCIGDGDKPVETEGE